MPKRKSGIAKFFDRARRSLLALLSGDDTYKAAAVNRLVSDWTSSTGASADDEVKANARLLRARSRDLARNNPYVRQFLNLVEVNVVGPVGAGVDVKSKDERGNESIEQAWAKWSSGPVTLDGRFDRVGLERLLVRAVARDGEAFVRLHRGREYPLGMALEPIDADLVDDSMNRPASDNGPEVRMGIEVDPAGRPLAYYVLTEATAIGTRNRIRVPASEMRHVVDPDRVHQSRGVPWAHPVMYALKMLDGYFEAEVVAARAGASKMGWFVRREGALPGDQVEMDGRTEANPGTIDFAPDGYEFQSWDPDHPSAAFDSFSKTVLRSVASGLGVSYPSLTGDLREVNYSSMRSALQLERDRWEMLQRWWVASFLRPIFEEWLAVAMLSRDVKTASVDPRAYPAQWTPRGWDWVDPQADIESTVKEIAQGLTSRQRVLRRRGLPSVEVIFAELAEEKKLAEKFGIEIDALVKGGGGPEDQAPKKPGAAPDDDGEDAGGNGNGNGKPKGGRIGAFEFGRVG